MNRSMLLSCGCNHSSKYADKFCCPKDLWWSSAEIINVTEQKRKSSTKRPRKEYQTWLSYEYLMCHECLQWPQRCVSEKESSFENRSLENGIILLCVSKNHLQSALRRGFWGSHQKVTCQEEGMNSRKGGCWALLEGFPNRSLCEEMFLKFTGS